MYCFLLVLLWHPHIHYLAAFVAIFVIAVLQLIIAIYASIIAVPHDNKHPRLHKSVFFVLGGLLVMMTIYTGCLSDKAQYEADQKGIALQGTVDATNGKLDLTQAKLDETSEISDAREQTILESTQKTNELLQKTTSRGIDLRDGLRDLKNILVKGSVAATLQPVPPTLPVQSFPQQSPVSPVDSLNFKIERLITQFKGVTTGLQYRGQNYKHETNYFQNHTNDYFFTPEMIKDIEESNTRCRQLLSQIPAIQSAAYTIYRMSPKQIQSDQAAFERVKTYAIIQPADMLDKNPGELAGLMFSNNCSSAGTYLSDLRDNHGKQ